MRRGDVTIRAGLPGPLPAPAAGPRHPWRGRSLPTRGQSGLGAGTSVTFCRVVKGDGPCVLGCPRPSPTYGASVCASVSGQILAPTRKGVRRWRPRTAVNACGVWELQAAGPARGQSVSSSRGGQSGTGRLQVDKSTRNDLGSTPHQQNGAPSPCWESRSPESVPSGAWTPLRRRQGTCQGTLPAENMDEPQVPGLNNCFTLQTVGACPRRGHSRDVSAVPRGTEGSQPHTAFVFHSIQEITSSVRADTLIYGALGRA